MDLREWRSGYHFLFNQYSQIELNHNHQKHNCQQTKTEASADLIVNSSTIMTSKLDRVTLTKCIIRKWYRFEWKKIWMSLHYSIITSELDRMTTTEWIASKWYRFEWEKIWMLLLSFNHYSQIELNHNHQMNNCQQISNQEKASLSMILLTHSHQSNEHHKQKKLYDCLTVPMEMVLSWGRLDRSNTQ